MGGRSKAYRARRRKWMVRHRRRLQAAGWACRTIWLPVAVHDEVKRRADFLSSPAHAAYTAAIEVGVRVLSASAIERVLRHWRETVPGDQQATYFKKGHRGGGGDAA